MFPWVWPGQRAVRSFKPPRRLSHQPVFLLLGGSVLFIESRLINPVEAFDTASSSGKDDKSSALSGSLTLTGKLGDVMKESCKIALTYAKSFLQQVDSSNRALRVGHIHVHVPEVSVEPFGACTRRNTFPIPRRAPHRKTAHPLAARSSLRSCRWL